MTTNKLALTKGKLMTCDTGDLARPVLGKNGEAVEVTLDISLGLTSSVTETVTVDTEHGPALLNYILRVPDNIEDPNASIGQDYEKYQDGELAILLTEAEVVPGE